MSLTAFAGAGVVGGASGCKRRAPDTSSSTSSSSDAANDTAACVVGAVPDDVRARFKLSAFYTRYVDYQGLPILSSDKPESRALCVARDVISHMLASRPELVTRLVAHGIRLAIMGKTELTTNIPEHADLTPKAYWDQRARGLGATLARPAVSAAEENVLCLPGDRYQGESILVHEFSHTVFNIGVELDEPAMGQRLNKAFAAAAAAGLFQSTYAITNRDEYWAEGAQDWFDTNASAVPANGTHNEIHTRTQLETYDPLLASLEADILGKSAWRYACPSVGAQE